MKIKDTWRGFTLIELLVVVLIIGVLAAIALPMYQKAVMKSRFAALMPIGKSMADSNEAYYLEHGNYADNADELPVQGQMDYPDGTEIEFGTTSEYAYVLASRGENFPNHYIVYQKHSEKFADNIHCEALESNDQAKEVCLSLGGEKIDGSLTDGYLTYVLSGMRRITDKFPTSISKLKSQICGTQYVGDNCIVGEDTITTRECTGTLTSTSGNKTCINKTYDDTGAQVDYERVQTECGSFSNLAYSNATKCTTSVYDEQNHKTSSTEDVCNLNTATWNNGECTWTSGAGTYHSRIVAEGSNQKSWEYSCVNASCTEHAMTFREKEGSTQVALNFVKHVNRTDIDTQSASWQDYSQNLKTTVSQPGTYHAKPSGNVTFTTTNTQTNEVVGTVTCAFANADWDTGTCKPGTAIP